jgi:hypothetical protein
MAVKGVLFPLIVVSGLWLWKEPPDAKMAEKRNRIPACKTGNAAKAVYSLQADCVYDFHIS